MKETRNNKTYKNIIKLLFLSLFISIVGVFLQIKSNNTSKYYFNYDSSIPEISIKKEKVGQYRTSVDYDTVYKKQNIGGKNDAVALIKKDSNIQKQKCDNKSIVKVENEIEKNYNIEAANLCELDVDTAESIKNVLDKIYNEFPKTRGYITNISLVNEEDTTGYIVAFMPSFAFASSNTISTYPTVKKTQILLNASYFLNLNKLKISINGAAASGWFVPNANVESLIAHEFGHYLSFLINMEEFSMNGILLINQGDSSTYNKMLSAFNNGKMAQNIIKEAYENYKKDTSSTISLIDFRKSISEYAIATDDKGNYIYDETIAEAMDDYYANGDSACDASKYIIQVLKKKLGGN